jgi:hypothetical protein
MESDVKTIISPLKITPSSDLNGPLNIFICNQEKENICIICLDGNNLIKNSRCSCIYYFHKECMKKIETPHKCILCKKISNETTTIQININIPVQPELSPNNTENEQINCLSIIICLIILTGIIIGIYYTF